MRWTTFFSSSEDKNRYLALDIGTDTVKALVFRFNKKTEKGEVIGVGKKKQKPGNMLSGGVADIDGVIQTSREALEMAMKKSHTKHIESAVLGIAGELVKGTTTTVHYQRIRPEKKIDISEMKEIMHQVQAKALERIQNQIAWETGQESIDIKLINAAVVNVRIDGYKINNPIGFQGTNVSISIFNAYAPLIHMGALESIADELEIPSVSIVAEPYAVSRVMATGDDRDFHAVFVDVGGGTTDVAVVRNGGLEGTKMCAIGGQSFTKHLAQAFRVDFDEAERAKLAFARGDDRWNHSQFTFSDIEEILREDSHIWLGGLELSLKEFLKNDVLPPRILLCGGGTAIPPIIEALSFREWKETLFTSPENVEITYMMPEHVLRMKDMTRELISAQDVTPLALANLKVEMLLEEKTLSGILRRAAREIT